MSDFTPSRRTVLLGLSAGLTGIDAALAQNRPPLGDNGIGGTGVPQRFDDRGIGGTGVYGRISGFGSVIVNGVRVAYGPAVPVFIHGRRVRPQAMRIGHIVRLASRPLGDGLETLAIEIEHLVCGPVERSGWFGGGIRILGQTIEITGSAEVPNSGEWVAISGIRRPDGVIVAHLVEAAPDRVARLTGIVQRNAAGQFAIGGMPVAGDRLARRLGMRVRVEGESEAGGIRVSRVVDARIVAPARRILVESYASIAGGRLLFGEGTLSAAIGDSGIMPAAGRQIIDAFRRNDGQFEVRAITTPENAGGGQGNAPGRGGGPGPGGPGGPGNSPGGPGGPGGGHGGGPGGGGGSRP